MYEWFYCRLYDEKKKILNGEVNMLEKRNFQALCNSKRNRHVEKITGISIYSLY